MNGLTIDAAKAAVRALGLKLTTREGKAKLAELMAPVSEPKAIDLRKPKAVMETGVSDVPSIDWQRARKTGGLFSILSELAEDGINPKNCQNWSEYQFQLIFNGLPTTEEQKIEHKFPLLFK